MRAAGILLPVFSLPCEDGIGTLGDKAFDFIDYLSDAKQTYWQVSPINHTNKSGSPYSVYSILSGNIYLIDIKKLVANNLLDEKSYNRYINLFKFENNRVDYKKLHENKLSVLKQAFIQGYSKISDEVNKFRNENSFWLEDYTLFICLKKYVFENKPWQLWDDVAKNRKNLTMEIYKEQLKDKIDFFVFLQYLFYKQWFDLKKYANSKNIKIFGEFPLYCELDSADVWANPELFMLNKEKYPSEILYHEEKNMYEKYSFKTKAVYNLDSLKKSNYKFLTDKLQFLNQIYDDIIIDNFDQYITYKVKPLNASAPDSNHEKYIEKIGMNYEMLAILKSKVPYLNPILYDFNQSNNNISSPYFTKIKIMQLGFLDSNYSACLPHNYSSNDVVYTSAYIFPPLKKWRKSLPGIYKNFCYNYIKASSNKNFNDAFIIKAYQSSAEKIIVPLQDILNLGKKSVLFSPTKKSKNWSWRVLQTQLNKKTAQKLRTLAELYER